MKASNEGGSFKCYILYGEKIMTGPLNTVKIMVMSVIVYRGYYTVARRYEFYVRVAETISHE